MGIQIMVKWLSNRDYRAWESGIRLVGFWAVGFRFCGVLGLSAWAYDFQPGGYFSTPSPEP